MTAFTTSKQAAKCKYCGDEVHFIQNKKGGYGRGSKNWKVLNSKDLSPHECRGASKVKVIKREELDPELVKLYESGINNN